MNNILAVIPVDKKDWIFSKAVTSEPKKALELEYNPKPDRSQIPCECCGNPCWIGPRQLAMKAEHPESKILCFVCIAEIGKVEGWDEGRIESLGGT